MGNTSKIHLPQIGGIGIDQQSLNKISYPYRNLKLTELSSSQEPYINHVTKASLHSCSVVDDTSISARFSNFEIDRTELIQISEQQRVDNEFLAHTTNPSIVYQPIHDHLNDLFERCIKADLSVYRYPYNLEIVTEDRSTTITIKHYIADRDMYRFIFSQGMYNTDAVRQAGDWCKREIYNKIDAMFA
jgi:hypothetical protein